MDNRSNYEKTTLLGRGPECTVFRGRNVSIDVDVAIKELPEEIRRNVQQRDRYFTEAVSAAKQTHPNVASVLDVDRNRGWIVSELLQVSLQRRIAEGPTLPDEVEKALRDCLQGMDYVHRQGYLLGSVKPTNLLFDQTGRVKLIDGRFISRDRDASLPVPRGSHKYIAPELLDSSFGAVGPGIDIYALGLVMVELLLGPQFDGYFRGVLEELPDPETGWVRWHTSREEERIVTSEWALGTPHRLATVLDRMVEKEQSQRYLSVNDILLDLNREEADQPPPGGPVIEEVRSERQAQDRAPAEPSPTPAKPAPPKPRLPFRPHDIGALPVWPADPVVLRLCSGPRCGEFIGSGSSKITLGSGLTCDISFLDDGYPELEELVALVSRESDGWELKRLGSANLFLNQGVISDKASLKSGDVIRLSPNGPDLQFLIQVQGQRTLDGILQERAPKLYAAAQKARKETKPAPAAPFPTPEAAPQAPPTASTESDSAAPSAPAGPADSAPSPPEQIVINTEPTEPAKSERGMFSKEQLRKSAPLAVIFAALLVGLAIIMTGGGDEAQSPQEAPVEEQAEEPATTQPS